MGLTALWKAGGKLKPKRCVPSALTHQFPRSRKNRWAFVAGTLTVAREPLLTISKATGSQATAGSVSADCSRNAAAEADHEITTFAPCRPIRSTGDGLTNPAGLWSRAVMRMAAARRAGDDKSNA